MYVQISSHIDDVTINKQEHSPLVYLYLPRQIRFCPLRQCGLVSRELAMWYLRCKTVGVEAMDMGTSFEDLALWCCSYRWDEWSVFV